MNAIVSGSPGQQPATAWHPRTPAEVAAEKLSKSSGTGPVKGPIKYSVTLDGKAHHVSVERV